MINAGRADFSLMELSSSNQHGFQYKGTKYLPVKGIYVTFNTSRNFIISRNTENAKFLLEMLNRGIGILKERGGIQSAYEQAGHQSTIPEDWINLSPKKQINKNKVINGAAN